MESEPSHGLARFLALNRTVGIVLITVLLFGLGEELWQSFLPVYLRDQTKEIAGEAAATGAVSPRALWTVGVFACLLNLFEGICYISGGQLTARLGDRGSLILFAVMTLSGYAIFLGFPMSSALTILACLLILGWEPLSVPVTFTTVGSTVTKERQGMAFAIQSIQKRLPKILGPAIAGFVLQWMSQIESDPVEGRMLGMQVLVGTALALGLISLIVQLQWMPHRPAPPPGPGAGEIVRSFHPTLRRLWVAEVFTRWCDWLVRPLVVLYIVFVHGVSLSTAGLLFALQNVTALITYLPIGQLTRRTGLQPFIGLTFIFFALFPLVLALVPDASWLWLAFIVYGLREIGEPARKALITSLMPEPVRARGVGLYWGLRSFALCWATLVGVGLWLTFTPQVMLYCAFALGCCGAAIFYLFARQEAPPVRRLDRD
jgi:MFS family permease